MKKMNKMKKMFASLAMAAVMVLGSAMPAKAEGNPITVGNDTTAKAEVVYKMADVVETPDTTFEITYTADGFYQNGTKVDGVTNPSIASDTITFNKNSTAATENDIKTLTLEGADYLAKFKAGLTASGLKAGVYKYTVKITNKSITKNHYEDELITDSTTYTLEFYVSQNTTTKALEVKSLVIHNGSTKTDQLRFTNEYIADAIVKPKPDPDPSNPPQEPDPDDPTTYGLSIEKKVDGANADNNTEFNFTMKIVKPDLTGASETTYDYYIVNASGKVGTTKQTASYGTDKVVKLKAGEKILVKNCYAGSKLDLKETGTANWTASYAATLNGTAQSNTNAAMGADLAITTAKLGQKTNEVTYTNTYFENAATGIIVNNLPFAMMIAIVAAAFVAIVVVNSKKRISRR